MGNGIADSILLRVGLCLMMLPTLLGMTAVLPDGFRYLLRFMKRLQAGVFFFILPDALMDGIPDGLPENVGFGLFRFLCFLFADLYRRGFFLGIHRRARFRPLLTRGLAGRGPRLPFIA